MPSIPSDDNHLGAPYTRSAISELRAAAPDGRSFGADVLAAEMG